MRARLKLWAMTNSLVDGGTWAVTTGSSPCSVPNPARLLALLLAILPMSDIVAAVLAHSILGSSRRPRWGCVPQVVLR